MFFFKPRPPVTEEERQWIESSLLRLIEMFGFDHFASRRTILPQPEFFPDRYSPTEEGLQALIARISAYMDVNADRLEFHVYSEQDDSIKKHFTSWQSSHSGAAGKYFHPQEPDEKLNIGIEAGLLNQPVKLVATIAHELGHVILLGGGLIDSAEEDHEHLTDLLTVFLGMGVFTANASFTFSQWQDGRMQGWSSSRQGYLTQAMFGYSLAACSWMRGESKVPWERLLTANVRSPFKRSLKFLKATQQTLLPKPKTD